MPIFSATGRSGWALVEALGGGAHVERGGDSVGGVGVGGHDRVADRLHHRTAMADRRLAQPVEMLLHQLVGVEVADALVERGRALDVGEQDRDVADREPLRAADDLGAEQAAKGLAGEQVLAGEVGIEGQEDIVVGSGGNCTTATAIAAAVGFAIWSWTGPGASVCSAGS